MVKKVQLQSNPKKWEVVDGVEVLVDQEIHDLDPITDSSCVKIEGHRTLEETINQDNMFTPEVSETKVMTEVGGVYHDNVVDGAYEKAILYGNTQVNLSEAVTIGSKYVPLPFTSFQGNEKKVDSPKSNYTCQVAPLIKGVTMVNLTQETSREVLCGYTYTIGNVKPNTKYTLSFTFTTQNNSKGIMIQSYNGGTYLENTKIITGLGEKVQTTFTTHSDANIVVICNHSSLCSENESIKLDNVMLLEGDMTDLDIPFFKGMRSVELVRPLTNLFTDDLKWGNQETVEYTNSGGNVTVTSKSVQSWAGITFYFRSLKQNTKYLVMWDSLTQTQTSTSSSSIIAVYDVSSNVNIGTADNKTECPTLRSIVFDTTGRDYTDIGLRVHATLSNSETGTTTVTGLRVFEWDDSLRTLDLQSIGYFSGTKNVCQHVFKTESKNLYPYGDVKFTNDYVGWCDAKGTTDMYGDIAQKSKTRFLLKKGTYTFTVGNSTNVNPIYIVSDKEEFISDLEGNKVFTLEQDTYCTLRVKTVEANVETTVTNIQIERGNTATAYSAYHGRAFIANGNDEIILRSLPNGVCDTYNLQTGELVQRILEFECNDTTIDGDISSTLIANSYAAVFFPKNIHGYETVFDYEYTKIVSDKMCGTYPKFEEQKYGLYTNYNNIVLWDSTVTSEQEFKDKYWGIKIQYELAEPITKTITTHDRTYNPITNSSVSIGNNLGAFTYDTKDHMMIVGNLSPVSPIVESITELPYKMRLKPNTTYTVKCVRGNSQTMSFDLGGTVYNDTTPITNNSGLPYKVLIKTPVSQLSHEYLKISGTGFAQNIIVVKGDITGTELPYFDGMCNAKMPIVKNIGKNLFDINGAFELGYLSEGNGLVTLLDRSTNFIRGNGGFSVTITSSYGGVVTPYIKVKPNTKYVASAEYINVPASQNNFVFYDINKKMIDNASLREVVLDKTFTTPSSCEYIRIGFWLFNAGVVCYENIQLEECLDSSLSTPYQQHKENSIYITQGELPFGAEFMEQGGFSMANSNDGSYEKSKYNGNSTIRLRSKDLIPVKPNTTYGILNTLSTLCYNVYQWDGNRQFLEGLSKYFQPGSLQVFTTSPNTHYIHFLMSKPNANNTISLSEYDWNNFHMYELDSTINLRSLPNGVKDELNLLTGEYIQRVGEVVLDGSENWELRDTNNYLLQMPLQAKDSLVTKSVFNMITNSSICANAGNYITGDYINHSNTFGITNNLLIYNSYNTPFSASIHSWKTHLSQNPLTVQYELAEPIISYPHIVSSNQEREVGVKLPNGVCNTYNPATGITTVRVGKVVLDGSEDWALDTTKTNTQVFRFDKVPNMVANKDTLSLYCETMVVGSGVDEERIGIAAGNLYIALLKTKASTVDQLKTYLASNPIIAWYELKNPTIQPDIVLPNGVHDDYNPVTGVYTKRVGYVELDGSVDEKLDSIIDHHKKENTIVFFAYGYTPLAKKYGDKGKGYPIYTNQFEYVDVDLGQTSGGGISMDVEGAYMAYDGNACFAISKKKLEPFGFTNDMNTKAQVVPIVSKYLSQNPLKVWYELQTPITYQLTPYFGLPTPYAYEDGYVVMESAYPETTLPPQFDYQLLANRTGQIVQNGRKLQDHTTRLSNLEAIIIEATIESLFNREMQSFELELMDIQLTEL